VFFVTFAKKTVAHLCMQITTIRRQPAEIDPKTVGAFNPPAFVTIAGNSPGIYPKHPLRAWLCP
jgi:hypothetical protein